MLKYGWKTIVGSILAGLGYALPIVFYDFPDAQQIGAAMVAAGVSLAGIGVRMAMGPRPGGSPGSGTALGLVLALCLGCATACSDLKGLNFGVSLTGDGVALTVGSNAWREQMAGVSTWAKWLSNAPTDQIEQHAPGLSKWLKALAG